MKRLLTTLLLLTGIALGQTTHDRINSYQIKLRESTAPSCSVGEYWIWADATLNTMRICNNLTVGTGTGSIALKDSDGSDSITIAGASTATSYTLTLPSAVASGFVSTNGSGTVTFSRVIDAATTGATRGADDAIIQLRRHATDCTAITDGKTGEACYEQDANTFYICEPTAGDCNTGAEWIQITGGGGGSWSSLTAPTGAMSMVSDGTSEVMTWDYQAAYLSGPLFLLKTSTGNPTGGTLLRVQSHDADVIPLEIHDATNVVITLKRSGAIDAASDVSAGVGGTTEGNLVLQEASGTDTVTIGLSGTLAASRTWDFPDASGTEFVGTTATQTLTNKTVDFEGTGNVITDVMTMQFDLASCVGAAAFIRWDDNATGVASPTAACNDTGTLQRPSADFSGSAQNEVERTFKLPLGWTGNIDVIVRYVTPAASPTGNVEWEISTVCRAVGESWDASFNAAQTITDAVGFQNNLNDAAQTNITTTGCAAEEDMTIRLGRDGVNDTNNDLAKALYMEVTLRRTK